MKNIFPTALLFLVASSLGAQNIDDAWRLNTRNVTGTARSMAMANAFGALGGDQSAISTNPAGIAVYRTSEIGMTMSLTYDNANTNYNDLKANDDKVSVPFNQIGFVSTYKPLRDNKTGLISSSFGIAYNRTADFNQNTKINVNPRASNENTLLNAYQTGSEGTHYNNLSLYNYAAYKTYLLNPLPGNDSYYFTSYEGIDGTNIYPRTSQGISQQHVSETSGYAGEYSFTYGANWSNLIYFGGSFNLQTYHYNEYSAFRETNKYGLDYDPQPQFDGDVDYFDEYKRLAQDGFGANVKLGAIVNLHPVKLGVAIHSPTFYSVDEVSDKGISSYFDKSERHNYEEQSQFSYGYRTPYRLLANGAYIFGNVATVSMDYEFCDYSFSKFSSNDNQYLSYFEAQNDQISEVYKAAHTIRLGMEVKPLPFIALRLGAGVIGSPINKGYTNHDATQKLVSGGIGIKNGSFFFDMAYQLMQVEQNTFVSASALYFDTPAQLNTAKHQLAFTIGWKY